MIDFCRSMQIASIHASVIQSQLNPSQLSLLLLRYLSYGALVLLRLPLP